MCVDLEGLLRKVLLGDILGYLQGFSNKNHLSYLLRSLELHF